MNQKARCMPPSENPVLLAVSHGTSSREGRAAVSALVDAVARALPAVEVRPGYVDVQVPKAADLVESLEPGRRAVVVPLLLSAGYHVHVDLVRTIEEARADQPHIVLAPPLGPDDRLVQVLRERVVQAGGSGRDRIVLAAAGSSDPRAVADCRESARRLGRLLGVPVAIGFLAAAEPTVSDAVRIASAEVASIARTARAGGADPAGRPPRIIVASYLLAPGYFYDLLRVSGADVISAPLTTPSGPVPTALVDLVVERYRQGVASLVPAS